jgi:hypothetical protein
MKQIPITPELEQSIRAAVGPDANLDGIAIFEAISANTLPLPGKRGTLFESAQISYLTLKQMADSINGGAHLPLVADHNLDGAPFGRVFQAGITVTDTGDAELRTLFYIDPTEANLIAKLDAGSLDEVSVNFLASQILCSECDFDYRGDDATIHNLIDLTCSNGHAIGQDGVFVRLVGLSMFTELSVVSRGASNNPKIVGKSQSKLAPPLQHLAAKGFEVDQFFLTASRGELDVDLDKIVTQLTEKSGEVAVLTVRLNDADKKVGALETSLSERDAEITELKVKLGDTTASDERDAAVAFLSEVYVKLATAAGETDVKAPTTIADLKAGIEKHNNKLTAVLPVGGVSNTHQSDTNEGAKFKEREPSIAAFKAR